MMVTVQQLKAIDPESFKFRYLRRLLEAAIQYVESKGGKAMVRPRLLEELGISIQEV